MYKDRLDGYVTNTGDVMVRIRDVSGQDHRIHASTYSVRFGLADLAGSDLFLDDLDAGELDLGGNGRLGLSQPQLQVHKQALQHTEY